MTNTAMAMAEEGLAEPLLKVNNLRKLYAPGKGVDGVDAAAMPVWNADARLRTD
jgi:putative phosphonate transport system ATP-binding protein